MNEIPSKIIAGDSLDFLYTNSLYDPVTWTATFAIRNGKEFQKITGSDDGNGSHQIQETAANTAGWLPGDYTGVISVSDGTDRHTVWTGPVTVRPDPLSGAHDDRTHVKRTLDILEDVIEGRVQQDTVSYSIGGRSVSKMGPEELITLHDRYKQMYDKEVREGAIASDIPKSNKIKVRFR